LPTNSSWKGIKDTLLNGWQVTGIWTARSGFPFGVVLGFDRANDASVDDVAQRPDLVTGRTAASAITGDPNHFVDATAFRLQPPGFYGNAGRNILNGPDLKTVDVGLFKNTNITENVRLQFRAEVFNLLNRANFALPDNQTVFSNDDGQGNGVVPGNFGQITRTVTTSRQIQFGLKFQF
jgi:hypothetical protein